jgi:hypothetical protein
MFKISKNSREQIREDGVKKLRQKYKIQEFSFL